LPAHTMACQFLTKKPARLLVCVLAFGKKSGESVCKVFNEMVPWLLCVALIAGVAQSCRVFYLVSPEHH
jgi:hypothetical protein